MKRRVRFLSTIFASCLALVMLGFGVYAATTAVTYDIEGTITYDVTDVYVEVNTRIYKSTTYLTKGQLADKVEEVASLSLADIETETSLVEIESLADTYNSSNDFTGVGEYSKGEDLNFNFATSGENVAFAYFIVMNIANLSSSVTDVYAVMQDDILDVENTFQYNNALQKNILSTETNRNMVIGIMVDDLTNPITANSPFSYGLNIARGDIAESEFMTAKYDATNGYANAKGVVVIDPNVNGGSFTGLGSSAVTALYVREGIETLPAGLFYNNKIIKKAVLSDGMTSLEGWNFDGCTNLVSVTLPDSITNMGDSAFESCKELTNIALPDNLITIATAAFAYCANLTNITIPDSVTSIGMSAFFDCTELTSIYMEHESDTGLTLGDSWNHNATVYYYSETSASGKWHYVDGVATPW